MTANGGGGGGEQGQQDSNSEDHQKKSEIYNYEAPWNKQDPRYMATIIMDCAKVVILDIRLSTMPVVELQHHRASVNAIAWALHSSYHICTAGDDSQALLWDLLTMGQPVEGGLDPILAHTAGAEIDQLQWSSSQPDWVAIAVSSKLQILRV